MFQMHTLSVMLHTIIGLTWLFPHVTSVTEMNSSSGCTLQRLWTRCRSVACGQMCDDLRHDNVDDGRSVGQSVVTSWNSVRKHQTYKEFRASLTLKSANMDFKKLVISWLRYKGHFLTISFIQELNQFRIPSKIMLLLRLIAFIIPLRSWTIHTILEFKYAFWDLVSDLCVNYFQLFKIV